jgi:5-methylcytosine-specific restriction endonuclease McrA
MTRPFTIPAFRAWLSDRGGIMLPLTNEWEVVRVDTCHGVLVGHRNKKGVHRFSGELDNLREDFRAGRTPAIGPEHQPRKRLGYLIEAIAARDGLECWFTGEPFMSAEDRGITIEHLCPKAHGGPDHISNLVLATEEWNRRAGHLSVAEKVRLREQARAGAALANGS